MARLGSPLFETIFFPLIEEIRLGRPEVDNLGAAVPVLLLHGTLLTVVGVRNARSTADDTPEINYKNLWNVFKLTRIT